MSNKVLTERELRHQISRVDAGHIGAVAALEYVYARGGYVGTGSAVSMAGRVPRVALTGFDGERSRWHPIYETPDGGTIPVVRAGRVPATTVVGAIGDPNVSFQRRSLERDPLRLPTEMIFHLGSYGWRDTNLGYVFGRHTYVAEALRALPPELQIGVADLMVDDDFTLAISQEPGHFASTSAHETVASMPIRVGDILDIQVQRERFEHLEYEPLSV